MRQVRELRWAREMDGWPGGIPPVAPGGKGRKWDGLKYEGLLSVGVCAGARHGVWYSYQDEFGGGYAQVDFLWGERDGVLLGEAKFTWTRRAYVQVRRLYEPILRRVYGMRFLGSILLCKNLTPDTPREMVVWDLSSAKEMAWEGVIPVLHVHEPRRGRADHIGDISCGELRQ